MTSLNWDRFRRAGAVVSAVLILCAGMQSAVAAKPDNTASPPSPGQAVDNDTPPAEPGAATAPNDQAPATPAATPQLQLQDEGPPLRDSDPARISRKRIAVADDTEDRPLWKHWAFWTVTGVLVVGAIGMILYTASGTNSSQAPCPPDIVVSLGCYGEGRPR